MSYPFSEYKFVGFKVSPRKHKKYVATIKNKQTKKEVNIHFGDSRYSHYKDQVLGKYSHLDHKDKKRREAYRSRHKNDKLKEYSPGYFSWNFLW